MLRLILVAGTLGCCLGPAHAQLSQQPNAGSLPGSVVQPGSVQPGIGAQPGTVGPFDQFGPFNNPNNFMPNIYNPQTQPLSPYLYTVRGNNPAVDYYFGTRPGTIGMGGRGSGGVPFMAMGGSRMTFFPQLANAPEPFQQPGVGAIGGTPSVLPAAGHPTVFNNTVGYFPSPFGQAGGNRSGLAGVGQGLKK